MIESLLFQDYWGNPILEPSEHFDVRSAYNPAVVLVKGVFCMFYRAVSSDVFTGKICLARSRDGKKFVKHQEPVIHPEHEYERYGCEDPRIVRIGDTFYLTYVGCSEGYNRGNICLALSKDLIHWEKKGSIIQPSRDWDRGQIKAGALLPEKVNGRYVMYFMGEERPWETAIGIAYSHDLTEWEEKDEPILRPRKGYFDSRGVEPGTNPLILNDGILMVYSGWGEEGVYKPAAVLFSNSDPSKVVERGDAPLLKPAKDWNKGHIVAEGLVKHEDHLWLYYGASDKFSCLATCRVV